MQKLVPIKNTTDLPNWFELDSYKSNHLSDAKLLELLMLRLYASRFFSILGTTKHYSADAEDIKAFEVMWKDPISQNDMIARCNDIWDANPQFLLKYSSGAIEAMTYKHLHQLSTRLMSIKVKAVLEKFNDYINCYHTKNINIPSNIDNEIINSKIFNPDATPI